MKDKWKVVKHGTNYVEVFSPTICPECGNLIEKINSTESLSGKWFFFDIFKKHWSEEHCICPSCNCEISRQVNKKLQVDWEYLLNFIMFLILVIAIIAIGVFAFLFCVNEGTTFLAPMLISVGIFIIDVIVIIITG